MDYKTWSTLAILLVGGQAAMAAPEWSSACPPGMTLTTSPLSGVPKCVGIPIKPALPNAGSFTIGPASVPSNQAPTSASSGVAGGFAGIQSQNTGSQPYAMQTQGQSAGCGPTVSQAAGYRETYYSDGSLAMACAPAVASSPAAPVVGPSTQAYARGQVPS